MHNFQVHFDCKKCLQNIRKKSVENFTENRYPYWKKSKQDRGFLSNDVIHYRHTFISILIIAIDMTQVFTGHALGEIYGRYSRANVCKSIPSSGSNHLSFTPRPPFLHIRVVPEKKIHHYQGQMKEFCPLISDLFLFFPWHLWLISHSRSKFSKTKGMKKIWKIIDFYVWYLKRTALKNVDWKWNPKNQL